MYAYPTKLRKGFLLIMIYFVGKAWEKIIPRWGPLRYINPGKFNIKEHAAAYIMTYTASGYVNPVNSDRPCSSLH